MEAQGPTLCWRETRLTAREASQSSQAPYPGRDQASDVGERFQGADALDYGLRHPSRGLRTAFRNVVADPFEIVRGVHRPADAHQPR